MNRNTIIAIAVLVILAVGIAGYRFVRGNGAPPYELAAVKRENLVQEVSAAGKTASASEISLRFKSSGKLSELNVKTGSKVEAGEILAKQDAAVLGAELLETEAETETSRSRVGQYEAALEMEKAKLEEIRRGSRPEEIKIAQTDVSNAENALADAGKNLDKVKNKSQADIDQAYGSTISAATKSIGIAENSLFVLTDIQYSHFNDYDQNGIKLEDAKAMAVYSLLGGQNAGRWSNNSLGQLDGGAKLAVEKAQSSPSAENIDKSLIVLEEALEKTKAALETIPLGNLSAAEIADVSAEKNNISGELAVLAAKQTAINVQKAANDSSISAAEAKINDAQNALSSARDNLAFKKAEATPEQISAQEAAVKQAEANILTQEAQIKQAEASAKRIVAQIQEMVLSAPVSGTVTSTRGNAGETVMPADTVISIMPEGNLQIDANISEADIVNVKSGQEARITLDAFEDNVQWNGKITDINPAETIIGGATYYKTTVLFNEKDSRIKPGMTANVWVKTAYKNNALAVPLAAIKEENGKKYVDIPEGKKTKRKEVETGLKGAGGAVEIVSGLNEGDEIITSIKKK